MSAVPEEVKAEDDKAEPGKKLFYCDVSGCLWGVFSPGSLWEPCGDWGAGPGSERGSSVGRIACPVPGRAGLGEFRLFLSSHGHSEWFSIAAFPISAGCL